MRALAVQQRTIWHPGTDAGNSTFIPASDPQVPEGLPENILTVRMISARDIRPTPIQYHPLINQTEMVASTWVIHNPLCKSSEHTSMNFLMTLSIGQGTGGVDWPGIEMGSPTMAKWTKVTKRRNFVSVIKTYNVGYPQLVINQTATGLCSYLVADDWITLTP